MCTISNRLNIKSVNHCVTSPSLIFLQLLIIQACQGETTPAGGDGKEPNLDSASESTTEVASSDAGDPLAGGSHVEIMFPNITLLMSTRYGEGAYRNHFIPAFSREISNPDGVRTVFDMFIAASNSMLKSEDDKHRQQNPEHRSTNRHRLVIPKRAQKAMTSAASGDARKEE